MCLVDGLGESVELMSGCCVVNLLVLQLVQTNLALYVQYVLDMESQFQYVIILLLVRYTCSRVL